MGGFHHAGPVQAKTKKLKKFPLLAFWTERARE